MTLPTKLLRLLTVVLVIIIYTGCTSNTNSNFIFTGDQSQLTIEIDNLPSQWKLENVGEQPLRDGTVLSKTYISSDSIDSEFISNSAAVFVQEKDAIEYYDAFYNTQKDLQGSPCINPPTIPKSEIANRYEVFCTDSDSLIGAFAYEFLILARYGNVVYMLSAVVVNKANITEAELIEAGMIRWEDMETLLKRIDEKFTIS